MLAPTLRPYQQRFIGDISEAMRSYKHCLCQAATGFGKTVCFSYIAQKTALKGNKILILSNRTELLTQAGGSLDNIGVKAEYISPKHRKTPTANVVVAMAQTLRRRILDPEILKYLWGLDLLIIDEAHAGDFDFIFKLEIELDWVRHNIFKNKYLLGFTATPKCSGKMEQLGLKYDCIVLGTKTQELIDLGFLKPARYFTLDAPDLSKVEVDNKDGDYRSRQLQAIYDTPERYNGLISEYRRITPNTSSLCFCANQVHAIQTCIEFNKAGISAKFLISGFGKGDDGYSVLQENLHLTGKRDDVIAEFKRGDFLVLVNAKMLTTGFDAPNVFTVILNMATLSLSLYLQMLGRGSRLFEGKDNFTVLDFGGNWKRHGNYEDDRSWSLWHSAQDGCGVAPTKICPSDKKDNEGKAGCGRMILSIYGECPFCRYVFATEKELRTIELNEVIGGALKFSEMDASQLVAYAELHGYNKTWAFRQMYIGGGNDGLKAGMKKLGYNWGYIYRQLAMYEKEKSKKVL